MAELPQSQWEFLAVSDVLSSSTQTFPGACWSRNFYAFSRRIWTHDHWLTTSDIKIPFGKGKNFPIYANLQPLTQVTSSHNCHNVIFKRTLYKLKSNAYWTSGIKRCVTNLPRGLALHWQFLVGDHPVLVAPRPSPHLSGVAAAAAAAACGEAAP